MAARDGSAKDVREDAHDRLAVRRDGPSSSLARLLSRTKGTHQTCIGLSATRTRSGVVDSSKGSKPRLRAVRGGGPSVDRPGASALRMVE